MTKKRQQQKKERKSPIYTGKRIFLQQELPPVLHQQLKKSRALVHFLS